MKKIAIIFSAAACALLLSSCQKELIEGEQGGFGTPIENVTFTASLPSTKVALAEDSTSGNLKGSWEVGDVIFGLKGEDVPVEFSVTEVDATTGVATLAQITNLAFSNGDALHAIYCNGKTSADLNDGVLAVDFSSQSLGNNPLVMTSDVTVSSNNVEFNFSNAVSIIGIEDPDYVGSADRTISKLILSGHEIVSSAKVVLEEGILTLKNDVPSNFIEYAISEDEYENEGGTITFKNPIYLAVPSCKIERATFVDSGRYIKSYLIDKTAAASKYYKLAEKTFESISQPVSSGVKVGNVTWAARNLGASSATSTGELYQWSGTELIYSEKTASVITPKPEFAGGFIAHTGYCYWDGAIYTKYLDTDGKTILDPVDDIVQLLYPGSGWRIPTLDDVESFNTEIEEKTIIVDSGFTYTKDGNSVVLRRVKDGASEETINVTGKYWLSTYASNTKGKVLQLNKAGAFGNSSNPRSDGLPIRPVRESSK